MAFRANFLEKKTGNGVRVTVSSVWKHLLVSLLSIAKQPSDCLISVFQMCICEILHLSPILSYFSVRYAVTPCLRLLFS